MKVGRIGPTWLRPTSTKAGKRKTGRCVAALMECNIVIWAFREVPPTVDLPLSRATLGLGRRGANRRGSYRSHSPKGMVVPELPGSVSSSHYCLETVPWI